MDIVSFWEPGYLKKHPKEDAIFFDERAGVFVVADGVTLWEGIEYSGKYPRVSGSAKLSKTFSKAFVKYMAGHPRASILNGFRVGNKAAAKVNDGRSKYSVLRDHKNLFAATAAMAVISKEVLYWAHICDSGVMVIDKKGKIKLRKESWGRSFSWPRDRKKYDARTWTFFERTIMRNGVSNDGRLRGYGVITGEPEAEPFLEVGKYKLAKGDVVVLYSDGFSPYLSFPQFRRLLMHSPSHELKKKVENSIKEKTAYLRRALKGKNIDQSKSVELIKAQMKKLLGKRYLDIELAEEKSIIIIKPYFP